jgi:hypothetical protein
VLQAPQASLKLNADTMGRVTEKVEAEQITATRSDERQRRKERVKWVFEGREIIQTNRDREDKDAERKKYFADFRGRAQLNKDKQWARNWLITSLV